MLFDLDNDISEKADLAEKQTEQTEELRAMFKEWDDQMQPPAFDKLGTWKPGKAKKKAKQ